MTFTLEPKSATIAVSRRLCRCDAIDVWYSHVDQSSSENCAMVGSEVVRHSSAFLMPDPIQVRDIRPAMTVAGRSLQADEAGT